MMPLQVVLEKVAVDVKENVEGVVA